MLETHLHFLSDGAGVDTTQGILRRFIFAMVANPEIQRRAQDEIDSVTEGKRVPIVEESVHAAYVEFASYQPPLTLYLFLSHTTTAPVPSLIWLRLSKNVSDGKARFPLLYLTA